MSAVVPKHDPAARWWRTHGSSKPRRGQAPSVGLTLISVIMVALGVLFVTAGSHPTLWTDWVWSIAIVMPVAVGLRNRVLARRVRLGAVHAPPATAHVPGMLHVSVHSTHKHPLDVMISVDKVDKAALVPGSGHTFVMELPPVARGAHDLPAIRVGCATPLWLFMSYVAYPASGVRIVYPAPEVHAPPWAIPHNTPRPGGHDTVSLRALRPGDGARQIAWKASARRNDVIVRECEDPDNQHLQWSWSDVSTLGVELGVSRLTAWVHRAEQMGRAYGLTLDNTHITPGFGPAHRHACLSALALFRPAEPEESA